MFNKGIVYFNIVLILGFLTISGCSDKQSSNKANINKEAILSNNDFKDKKEEVRVVSEELNNLKKEENKNKFSYESLPETIIHKINGVSWKKGSPVKFEDLVYVKVAYWGFDEKEYEGELVVNKKVAKDVVEIFKELYDSKFYIDKIKLIDEYDASDALSMSDNNTSSFCFRQKTNGKSLSKHSYGLAIDINPIQNPYIKGDEIEPSEGKEYTNRQNLQKGMITRDSTCYKAFISRGWNWGGDWKSLKDYQHFEKKIK